ncbi:MAG TPA: methyltransferase domain-containing protein [Solirubrobacteraceae bacterium]|nr:methyltransferase domain-containing protein [Solirubrobacteraceae bacterium]
MVEDATISLPSLADIDWCGRFERLLSLRLPDLTGKTVLDVSALDGYFSFAAERFGASQVVTVDLHAWGQPGTRDRFERERDRLRSKVEDLDLRASEVSRDTVGQFDVVLFLGALNGMRDRLLALERIAGVTKELLVAETLVDRPFPRSAATSAHPRGTAPDETHRSGLDRTAIVEILHAVGFSLVVSYQPKRLSVGKLLKFPASARTAVGVLLSTPQREREQLVRRRAKSLFTQRHLVTHSSR